MARQGPRAVHPGGAALGALRQHGEQLQQRMATEMVADEAQRGQQPLRQSNNCRTPPASTASAAQREVPDGNWSTDSELRALIGPRTARILSLAGSTDSPCCDMGELLPEA